MKKFLEKIYDVFFKPKITETETHYLVELYSEDGNVSMWLEKPIVQTNTI